MCVCVCVCVCTDFEFRCSLFISAYINSIDKAMCTFFCLFLFTPLSLSLSIYIYIYIYIYNAKSVFNKLNKIAG